MEKISTAFFLGILLILIAKCLPAQCPLQQFNMLDNPSFEVYGAPCDPIITPPDITINGAFNDGCVQGWQSANTTPSICSPDAANGANCVCLGNNIEGIFQNVPLCEGQQYRLTFQHRSHSSCVHLPLPCSFNIYLASGLTNVPINDPIGFTIDPSWQHLQLINTTTDWETETTVFTAGNLLNNQLLFLSEGSGDVFLDNFSLTCEETQTSPDFTVTKICDGKYSFNGNSNNVPGNILTWCWDFGDGTTALGQNVIHTFPNPGSYNVELSVTSDQCFGCVSRVVYEVVSETDLSIQKTYTENLATGELTFTISVHNNSNATISNIEVSDQLNAGLSLLNPNGFIVNGNTLTRTISVAGSKTTTLSFTATRACACGPITNCATARVNETGCQEVASCVTVSGFPTLTELNFETSTDLENCFNIQFEADYDGEGICTEYSWDFGDGTFGTGASIAHEYTSNGVYSVVLQVTTPCGIVEYNKSITILCYPFMNFTCSCDGANTLNIDAGVPSIYPSDPVPLTSILDTEIPDHTVSSSYSTNTLFNTCLAIKGNLIIDNNFDLAIIGGEMRMQPGARVIVAPGARLTLGFINGGSGAEEGIHGCEQMWRSIEVQPGGALRTYFNVVQDGEFAFDVKGATGTTTSLHSVWNTFDRNHVSIRVDGSIAQPYSFQKNKFWATADLLPQFSDDFTNWDLQNPYAGIQLKSTSFFVGTESNSGSVNEFDGLRNGILSNRSVLRVYHAKFLNAQGALGYQEGNPNFNNSQGIGIFAKSGESLLVKNSTFDNGPRAVHTELTALEFKNNLIQNVDVGLWNKPGQGQTINIYDNDIYFRGYGIYVGSPTTTTTVFIDRNDPIQTQPSNIDDPTGVWINAGPSASTVIKRIADNQFNLHHKDAIGIWLNSSGNWRLQDNRVDYFTPAAIDGTGQGFSLSGSDDNYLRKNYVYGTGSDDKFGFLLKSAERCTLCCNFTDDLWRGLNFQGQSDPTYLRHNEMVDHNMGLLCNSGARIGDQLLGGNIWSGGYGFASAVHAGIPDDIQNSEFYIEPGLFGTDFWPLDVTSPASPGLWFRPWPLPGTSLSCTDDAVNCPSLPPPPGTPEPQRYPNASEYQIAGGIYGGSGTYSVISQFEAERSLYRNIRRGTVMTNNAPTIAQFYATATNGAIGKFDEVERRIETMWQTSASARLELDSYQNSINNLADNINRIDSLYAFATTLADTLLLQNQKNACFAAMQAPLQQWQLLTDNVRTLQQGLVPAIAALNNTVPYGNTLTNNRKTLNRIYLETVALDNYVTTQAQRDDLLAVASQCFLTGGDAVLQARALYAVLVAPLQINDDLLCGSQPRPDIDSRNAEQTATRYKVGIIPNPAQDQFSVQVEGAAVNAMLRVQVLAANGNVVRDATIQNGQVLTHAFAPGFYVCRIYVGEELVDVVKLVIVP